MQERFKKQNISDIIFYLQYKDKIKISPFYYTKYGFHNGKLDNIIVVDFYTETRHGQTSHPFIIDLYDYYDFFRRLKLKLLKNKMK
jgi:hypothetical protein